MGRPKVERVAITCHCGTTFYERASRRRKYCSKACEGRSAAKRYAAVRVDLICEFCGKPFTVRPALAKSRFCGLQCKQVAIARATAAQRSEKLRARGAKPTTYRKLRGRHEHRVRAEEKLGRPLRKGEIVHHDDENRQNNSHGNLIVLPGQGEHARLHSTKNRKCSIPGCGRKHAGKGYCMKHWKQNRKGKLKV